jgi:hypothetical protein
MKSQVAVEFLIIVSVAFMILIPLSVYLNQSLIGYKDTNKISKAWNTVKKLGESADWVYSQGPPAKLSIEIYIPDDLEEVSLENNTILFRVRTSAGISDAFYETVPPLSGTLPSDGGYYFVSLTAFSNHVEIEVV